MPIPDNPVYQQLLNRLVKANTYVQELAVTPTESERLVLLEAQQLTTELQEKLAATLATGPLSRPSSLLTLP